MTMIDDICSLPSQLRWGSDLELEPLRGGGPIVLLGMGGSAMAATVAALGAASRSPMVVHRGYGLPAWAADSGASVIAVSYSGNTEEVLSGVDAAITEGLEIAAVASGGRLAEVAADRALPIVEVPGGLQPRAGVGYQAAAVAAVLAAAGHMPNLVRDLNEAADVTADLLGGGDGAAFVLARDIAEALEGRTAVVYGGLGVGATAAYRWKTQINENAKMPAFSGAIPEMNHNELEGWRQEASGGFGVVYLHDVGDHPAVARRIDLSGTVLSGKVRRIGDVRSRGSGAIARFFSLAVVGDAASVALADAAGLDPTPVENLEEFKIMLAKGTP
jgi:glucose/mannose-6-phosphate isomerase